MKKTRLVRSLAVAAVLGGWAAIGAGQAFALAVTPDTGVASTNGKVFAVVRSGNTMFLGGRFGKLVPTDGTKKLTAIDVGAIDMTTGQPVRTFSASLSDATAQPFVQSLAVSPDGSTLYIAGSFQAINGVPRENLAAVDAATGEVLDGFDPNVGTAVNIVMVGPDGTVYFGGAFGRVDGIVRNHLAAVDPAGDLDPDWLPSANDNVRALVFAEDGNTIFVGGKFTTMDGVSRVTVARVTPDTGALDPWTIPAGTIKAPQQAWSLAPRGNRLYGGFGNHGNFAAAFRLDNGNSGDQLWRVTTSGNVEQVAINAAGTQLFIGGHFGTGGTMRVCGTLFMYGVGILDPATGAVDCTWLPHMLPDTHNQKGAKALYLSSTELWVGGFFTSISGVPVVGIARYTL